MHKFHSRPFLGHVAIAVASCAAFAFSGCNSSPVKLYPVEGKVLYKNQPVAGAQVVLQPQEEGNQTESNQAESNNAEPKEIKPMAFGTVRDDGTAVMRSDYQGQAIGEGVAPGNYDVLITWYGADAKNPEKSINKLPPKYSDQSKPVYTVTVKTEKNVLEPFQLK